MLDKARTFVSNHKSHIATAAVAAGVGGAVVFVYFNKKTFLHLSSENLKLLESAPEDKWLGYLIGKTTIAVTAVDPTKAV